MSNNTDSGVDFAYAMPESIAKALGSQGFAEAARAFQSIGGDEVSSAMRAQLNLVMPQAERVVTASDIEKELAEFISRAGMSSGSQVDQARALLNSLVGRPYSSIGNLSSLLEQLNGSAQGANSLSDAETTEQRITRLWTQIEEQSRQIDDGWRALAPYATEEQRRERAELQDNLAQANTPQERLAATQAISQFDQNNLPQVIEAAERSGNHRAAEEGRAIMPAVEGRADNIRALNSAYSSLADRSVNNTAYEAPATVNSASDRNSSAPVNEPLRVSSNLFGGSSSAATAAQPNNLTNNQDTTRLAYADAAEGQFVPLQPTPAAAMAANGQSAQL